MYLSNNDDGENDHILGMIEQYSQKSFTGGKKDGEVTRADRTKSAATLPTPKLPAAPHRANTFSAGSTPQHTKRKTSSLLPGHNSLVMSPSSQSCVLGVNTDGVLTDNSNMMWDRSEEMIENCHRWDFDVLKYDPKTLLRYSNEMMHYYSIMDTFEVKQTTLQNFIVAVSKNYRPNPFHSFYHAVAVLHVSFMMLSTVGCDQFLQERDVFAVLTAALCHDLDHPGTTNDFQKASLAPLALLYNDRSILENHHAATAFKIMQSDENNILDGCGRDDFAYIRKLIIELILKTDMANHFDMVKKMQIVADSDSCDDVKGAQFQRDNDAHRLEVAGLVVHCADLSNPVYPTFDMTQQWCFRVCEEFSQQAEKEREIGLPVTSFMEGLTNEYSIAKLQIGFVNYVILPLWKVTGLLFPKAAQHTVNCVHNVKKWQEIVDGGESPGTPGGKARKLRELAENDKSDESDESDESQSEEV